MAQPVNGGRVQVLSVWSEDSARVDDILTALEDLRRPEPMPPTRTSVLNLVIVSSVRSAATRAQEAVHELGGRHPARVLTLFLDPDGPRGLEAQIRLLGGEAAGKELWFEDIELDVHGDITRHLHSLIEPLTLSGLPVVVWFLESVPASDDPLLMASDVLMVDSRQLGDDCFPSLRSLIGRRPMVDLSWVRLQPWRELLAGLFDGQVFLPFLTHVQRAEVAGRYGPRNLLGGWLADRLDLGDGVLVLEPGEHVSLRLHCRMPAGDEATFEVIRMPGGRSVHARAAVQDGPVSEGFLELPEATPAWGLADALARLERDPVYEAALRRTLPVDVPIP